MWKAETKGKREKEDPVSNSQCGKRRYAGDEIKSSNCKCTNILNGPTNLLHIFLQFSREKKIVFNLGNNNGPPPNDRALHICTQEKRGKKRRELMSLHSSVSLSPSVLTSMKVGDRYKTKYKRDSHGFHAI